MIYQRLALAFCAVLLSVAAWAADPGAGDEPGSVGSVVVDGKLLFHLRTPGIWASPEERGALVSRRIRQALHDKSLRDRDVTTGEDESGTATNVLLGETILISVSDDDAKVDKRDRQGLARFYAMELQRAILAHRRMFSPWQIGVELALLLLVTAAFIGLLKAMARIFPRLSRKVDALEHVPNLWGILPEASRVRLAENLLRTLVREARLALTLVLLYFYVAACLRLLPWTKEYYYRFSEYVLAPIVNSSLAVWHYLPNLAVLAVIVLATRYVIKGLMLAFGELARRPDVEGGFHPEWAKPTYKLMRFVVIAFAVVMAFPYLPGSESPAFKGVSIFIGVLVSLGSTSAISNIAAGVILIYSRSFRIGDWVRIGETVGEVVESTLLVTRVRTARNVRITIPNGSVMGQSIENFSAPGRGRAVIFSTAVTIGYDTPWRQVEALLLQAARATTEILLEPKPFVLQTGLDDFYVRHELHVFTATPHLTVPTLSALHRNILDVFNEYGVQIMSPNYEADPPRKVWVPKEQWFAAPATPPGDGAAQGAPAAAARAESGGSVVAATQGKGAHATNRP
jgi:small-conductance mechanosensitive channel